MAAPVTAPLKVISEPTTKRQLLGVAIRVDFTVSFELREEINQETALTQAIDALLGAFASSSAAGDDPGSAPSPSPFQQTYGDLAAGAVAGGGVLAVAVNESLALIAESSEVTGFAYLTPSPTTAGGGDSSSSSSSSGSPASASATWVGVTAALAALLVIGVPAVLLLRHRRKNLGQDDQMPPEAGDVEHGPTGVFNDGDDGDGDDLSELADMVLWAPNSGLARKALNGDDDDDDDDDDDNAAQASAAEAAGSSRTNRTFIQDKEQDDDTAENGNGIEHGPAGGFEGDDADSDDAQNDATANGMNELAELRAKHSVAARTVPYFHEDEAAKVPLEATPLRSPASGVVSTAEAGLEGGTGRGCGRTSRMFMLDEERGDEAAVSETDLAAVLGLADAALKPPRPPPVPIAPPRASRQLKAAFRDGADGGGIDGNGGGGDENGNLVEPNEDYAGFSGAGSSTAEEPEEKNEPAKFRRLSKRVMETREMYVDEEGRVGVVPGRFVRSEGRMRHRRDAVPDRARSLSSRRTKL